MDILHYFKRKPACNAPEVESLPCENTTLQKEPVEMLTVKHCPFCGKLTLCFLEQTILLGSRHDGVHKVVFCENCGAKGPLAKTAREAAYKWNNLYNGD